ncbi:hypothetical protein HI914_06143 [Erysiphe necator]|uniref:Uncharacterized protein n=1 Tax=Uncinula necator TaxID=52586 RepID=A0A0B1P9C9_UNCNE|nr:hypothetical protein HI914_06143 [Erysiphe necator]KHJ33259.1 hypothetical protein EV44_g1477 [Erysiphe necator]
MNTPKLVDLPDSTLNSETPTEAPGTPNSTTTSLSTLSTTAIKDGHRGIPLAPAFYGSQQRRSSNILEAERADRISRLAGLERVSGVRFNENPSQGGSGSGSILSGQNLIFDANGNPININKKSTVGSASMTGSMGERTTTWASGSMRGDDDCQSLDTADDRDRFSASAIDEELDRDTDGMSDNQSLVGFGEGAGSTGSGPIYVGDKIMTIQNQSGPNTQMPTDPDRQSKEVRLADRALNESPSSSHTDTIRYSEGKGNVLR